MITSHTPHIRLSKVFCIAGILLSTAHLPAAAVQNPCVFTATELSKLVREPLREPEIRKPAARYSVNCAFESVNQPGKKVFIAVRKQETPAEFAALQRLAYLTNKDQFRELQATGKAAFLTPYAMRAWDGTHALSIKGMKDVLMREITPKEATLLMQVGLAQLPSNP